MLSSDLDSEEDKDKSALVALLATLILQLNMQSKVRQQIFFTKLPEVLSDKSLFHMGNRNLLVPCTHCILPGSEDYVM